MALSFDPQKLPVIGVDDHLPAVTAADLRSDALRSRFMAPPVWSPEIKTEHRFTERAPAHASVLIALVPRNEITVLLTQRTAHLTDHPGQISFPGGRVEPEDADAAATALREAHEEIGLEPGLVHVLGALTPVDIPVSGFRLHPIMAAAADRPALRASDAEVARIRQTPLGNSATSPRFRAELAKLAGKARPGRDDLLAQKGRRSTTATAV